MEQTWKGGDRKPGRRRRKKRRAGGSCRGGEQESDGIRRHQVVEGREYCTQCCSNMLVSLDFIPRAWEPMAKF